MNRHIFIKIIYFVAIAAKLGFTSVYSDDINAELSKKEIETLRKDIESKNKEIEALKIRVKELEAELQLTANDRIETLEARLNKDFGAYEDVDFKTFLSGGEEEIRVKIYPDCKNDYKEWVRFSSSKREDLVESIANEILLEFPSARVKGYIKDSVKRAKIYMFYTDAEGKIRSGNYKNFSMISELEANLNDSYSNYLGSMDLAIELAGNENNIVFRANFIRSMYESYWARVPDSRIKEFMSRIYVDITREFKNCNVRGIIFDVENEAELAEYSKDGNSAEFYRSID